MKPDQARRVFVRNNVAIPTSEEDVVLANLAAQLLIAAHAGFSKSSDAMTFHHNHYGDRKRAAIKSACEYAKLLLEEAKRINGTK